MACTPNADSEEASSGGFRFIPREAVEATLRLNQLRKTQSGDVVVEVAVIESDNAEVKLGDYDILLKYADKMAATYSDKELRQIIASAYGLSHHDASVKIGPKYEQLLKEGENLKNLDLQLKLTQTMEPAWDKKAEDFKRDDKGEKRLFARKSYSAA